MRVWGGMGEGGTKEIQFHRKDASTKKKLSFVECVWQPVPDNVAPYVSDGQCLLFVFSPNPEILCLHRGAERTNWVVSVGNRCMLVLCPWGTGFCWYCIRGKQVSAGIVSTGLSCFCVQFSSHCTWQG